MISRLTLVFRVRRLDDFVLKGCYVAILILSCSLLMTTLIFGEVLSSPEVAIEKYCKLDLEGVNLSSERAKKIFPFIYWPIGGKVNPGWDFMVVVSNYSIKRKATVRKFDHDVVQFEVSYDVLGLVHGGPEFIEKSEKETIIIEAIKINNGWKIVNPILPPHVSIETAINHLNDLLNDYNEIERKNKCSEVINILRAKNKASAE
jgi:hypothetical protein